MLQKFSESQVRDSGIFDTVFFQQVVATHFLPNVVRTNRTKPFLTGGLTQRHQNCEH